MEQALLSNYFFATTNLVPDFTDVILRCGCHLSKRMKSRISCSFKFFLDRVESASRQSSHRIITFRDQLALAFQTIAAKTDSRSMS